MTAVLLRIVEALVDNSRAVEVHSEEVDGVTCLRLRVGPSDVGKLIGKQGRMARSMRTILGGVSTKVGRRITLDILEGGRL